MRRRLSPRDVGELLSRSGRTADAVLVGGQALNVWALHYGVLGEGMALSDDIDFVGDRAQALAAGLDWQGEVRLAGFDDHTPNAATVVVDIDGERHTIDFLQDIKGVEGGALRAWAIEVRGRSVHFRVLHPLHVLASQLANAYGELDRRRDPKFGTYARDRVKIAIEIARHAIREILKGSETRQALKAAEFVFDLSRREDAVRAYAEDGLDVLKAIPSRGPWPEAFRETRLPQAKAAAEARRLRDQSRRTSARRGRRR